MWVHLYHMAKGKVITVCNECYTGRLSRTPNLHISMNTYATYIGEIDVAQIPQCGPLWCWDCQRNIHTLTEGELRPAAVELPKQREIMQAYLDGKQIQILKSGTSDWVDIDMADHAFSFRGLDKYRVKPVQIERYLILYNDENSLNKSNIVSSVRVLLHPGRHYSTLPEGGAT